jgi:hypothetical protein
MSNERATWEEIISLARWLDSPGHEVRPEDQLRLAIMVLDFDENVVGRAIKRPEQTGAVVMRPSVLSADPTEPPLPRHEVSAA